MAPKRGRPKKNKTSPVKPVEAIQDTSTADETTSDVVSDISSINPKEQVTTENISEELSCKAPNMEVDDLALQSTDQTSHPSDADSHLLYEGDDINQEVSYAPEDVDALLGNDENEGLENAEEYGTEEEAVYNESAVEADYTETGDVEGGEAAEEVDENADASDTKAKAKLVKTTYHYVNDKSDEKAGNITRK